MTLDLESDQVLGWNRDGINLYGMGWDRWEKRAGRIFLAVRYGKLLNSLHCTGLKSPLGFPIFLCRFQGGGNNVFQEGSRMMSVVRERVLYQSLTTLFDFFVLLWPEVLYPKAANIEYFLVRQEECVVEYMRVCIFLCCSPGIETTGSAGRLYKGSRLITVEIR